MSASVPFKFTKNQYRNIIAMCVSGVRTMSPLMRPSKIPQPETILKQTLPAPSNHLVDEYCAWVGAPPDRYANVLPPHFCSHWAFGLLSNVSAMVPYNLREVLNQGAHIQVRQPIPRGVRLHLRGNVMSVVHDEARIRIHIRIVTSTDDIKDAHILDSFISVPLKSNTKHKVKKLHPLPAMREVGGWTAEATAGVDFARLTGDFNPIHVFVPMGRLAGFGGCILHGFGFMAKSWEACLNDGELISEADLRFTKPLRLPTKTMSVLVSENPDETGKKKLVLKDCAGETYLAGTFA